MPHLRLDRVTKQYGAVTALREVDLAVEAGEFLTLLGPSGCGKTTVLRLIAGFVEPSGGRVLIDDADVTRLAPNRRSIGMVFQSYALFPHLTVARNIAFPLEERGLPQARIRERVGELLGLVRLTDIANRYPAQLSGGQQQRVALARAVAHTPRVLLMDEPLGALDLKLRETMQLEIRRIQQTLRITTLYVTHDQTEAMRISDRIAIMNQGGVEQCGTVAEVYNAPRTRFVADFMGKINLIPGRVAAIAERELAVQTELGLLPCSGRYDIAVGVEVSLGIRPDEIEVAPMSGGPRDVVRATGIIEEMAFLGTLNELRVRISSSLTLQVETRPASTTTRIGNTIEVGWRLERCMLFRQ
jgi:putative spermidine/putrescine transport system ATP-binding protein